ncbi:MAG: response regulator [Phycisphaera sp.]|nr:MAG: response regulator [Phycisphaera sp.]
MRTNSSEPIEYIANHVKTAIKDPGGTRRYLEVQTRLLTPSSVVFITQAFLHVSSIAMIDLPKADNTAIRVKGTITDCKHNGGRFHVCVVQLENKLDLAQFMRQVPSNNVSSDGNPSSTESTADGLKPINTLYLDDLDSDRNLLQHKAKGSHIKITVADSTGSACDKLKLENYDVVVCDFHLEDTTGIDVISMIRPDLYSGPVIIMTAETRDEELARMLEAGADAVLTKPVTMSRLSSALNAVLAESADNGPEQYDPFDAPPEDMELASSYIPMLTRFRDEFIRAKQKRDIESSLRACRSVMGSASGYGFQRLGGTAERAYAAIQAARNIDLAGSPVTDFIEHMKAIIDSANKLEEAGAV